MPFVSHDYLRAISREKRDQLYRSTVPLGYQPETGDELLLENTDRYAGMYVLGVQGCLHPATPIFDPVDGTTLTVLERYTAGKPFNVLALDGQNIVVAKAEAPLRYTTAPMYELSSGVHRITVTGQHRVWDGSRYTECGALYTSQGASGVLLPTVETDSILALPLDARRLTGISTSLYQITKTADAVYYDFHVPTYENYYACGLFHHNTGKSGLLENLIAADMEAGNAVIVIDPHGDLMTHCLAILPPHRLPHTYLLDMEDEGYPFGINIFSVGTLSTSIEQSQAVERIMHVFEVLWPDVLSQQNLPLYVRAATVTFLANPGATLVDMLAFLQDQPVRQAMLARVANKGIHDFWKSHDALGEKEGARRLLPLTNRLQSLFMGRSLVSNIVGQRQQTINFRQVIERQEVLFIRLPIKTVMQDARLIGTMIMSQIHAAVFSFADVPEAQRPGVSLYVDEVQNFASSDFAELFSEGRKFGMKLTIAHQYRSQLPAFLQASTMTARTKVCFQTTPEDGREMAHIFPAQEARIHPEDIEAHPVEHLLTYGTDNPFAQVLIDDYLRPLQSQKHGGKVDIDGPQLVFDLWNGLKQKDVYVADPTPYLNNLLYQVMRTGNAAVPIPSDAIMGLANCGRGLFGVMRGLTNGETVLAADVDFPPVLVVYGADNQPRWTRPPESGMEQLYHLLFHLRMTMVQLAAEPIGKPSPPSTTAVGQMLNNLPRRAAFVRMGETVGVIYTHDTPPRLEGQLLRARAQAILTHTRQVYAHPRNEVEQMWGAPDDAAAPAPEATSKPPVSRWEEV